MRVSPSYLIGDGGFLLGPTVIAAVRDLDDRVTWGKAPPFGDDLSLTYLFASTSEKSYIYVTNYMLCV